MRASGAARCALVGACLGLAGCGAGIENGGDPSTLDPVVDVDPNAPADHIENDDNAEFARAEPLSLDGEKPFIVQGSVEPDTDVDVFDVGPVERGDRVVADLFPDPSLNAVIAAFDENGESLLVNDYLNVYLGRKEPYIDVVFRRSTAHAYIAVAAAGGTHSSGGYELAVRKSAGQSPLPARPQIALLNFAGAGDVALGDRTPVNVPAFSAESISAGLAGQTDALEATIVSAVRQDYLGFDVTILSTSEGDKDNGAVTRIHFGTFDPALLGVAEGVDEFNERPVQDAIVFTDTFSVFMSLDPSVSELGQALANVASHELGHLLGLIHTRDSHDIMDVSASLVELLEDQHFASAPIDAVVFPTGRQNGVQYVYDVVGGDLALVNRASALQSEVKVRSRRTLPFAPTPPRPLMFGTCGLCGH